VASATAGKPTAVQAAVDVHAMQSHLTQILEEQSSSTVFGGQEKARLAAEAGPGLLPASGTVDAVV